MGGWEVEPNSYTLGSEVDDHTSEEKYISLFPFLISDLEVTIQREACATPTLL